MGIPQKIQEYLRSEGVPFEWLHHPQAFTAQELAHSMHLSGKRLAKTIVVAADGQPIMAVLPASHRLNLNDLRSLVEAREVEMLPEAELAKIFPDCELGAIPPLGSLYGIEVWVDKATSEAEEIVFSAGTHADSIRTKYADFARLVKPHEGRFSDPWMARAA
jgi:Ala-tRNA(Pro) deacylase